MARPGQTTAACSEEVPFEAEGRRRACAAQDSRKHRDPEAAGDSAEGIGCRHGSRRNLAAEAADGRILGVEEDRHSPDEEEEDRHNLEGEEEDRHIHGEEEDLHSLEGEDRRDLEEDPSPEEAAGQVNRSRNRPGHRDGVGRRGGLVQGIQTWSAMKRFEIQAAQTMKQIKFSAAEDGARGAKLWTGDRIVASNRRMAGCTRRRGSAQPKRDRGAIETGGSADGRSGAISCESCRRSDWLWCAGKLVLTMDPCSVQALGSSILRP